MTADVYYGYLKGEKERAVGLLPKVRQSDAEVNKIYYLDDIKYSKRFEIFIAIFLFKSRLCKYWSNF